jgi:hypothetical protein|tara:strand:- start:2887 stop:3246 length:360 start_codon:yes stop_codon:yes gene_type:complete
LVPLKTDTFFYNDSLKIPLDKRFAIGARCGFLTALTSDVARKKMTATLRTLNDRTVTRGVSLPVIVTKIVPNGGGVFCQVTGTRRFVFWRFPNPSATVCRFSARDYVVTTYSTYALFYL